MATSLTATPSSFCLTKNQRKTRFGIQSDAYIATPGTFAEIGMGYGVSNNPTNGLTLIIDAPILTNPVTFVFTSGVPANSLEVAIGASSADTNNNLFAAILLQYELVQAYQWTKPGATILATARQTGSDYDFSITGTSTIVTSPTAGTDEVVLSDLRIIADLWIKTGSGTYDKKLSQSLTPDSQGEVIFDLGEVLISFLSAYKPGFYEAVSSLAVGPVVTYRLRHTDFYSDEYHDYQDSGDLNSVLAGYPERLLSNSLFPADYFTGTAARKFLTRIPRGYLSLPPEAPFYLYYWCSTNGTYRLGVTLYYDDSTNETVYDLLNRATENNLVAWPAGYDLLDIDSVKASGKTVRHYDVFVINALTLGAATITSEMFRILVDENYYLQSRYFMFLNSLGGMDTVHFTGNLVKSQATEGDDYQTEVPEHDEETTHGELKTGIKTFTNPGEYYTGWKSKEYTDYLQDLVKSELIYELTDQYVEMKVLTTDLEVIDENADQYGLQLKMMPAQINRGYAP